MEFVAPHWRSMVFGRASPFSPHNPPPPPGATRSGMLLAETPLDKWSDPGRDYVRVLLPGARPDDIAVLTKTQLSKVADETTSYSVCFENMCVAPALAYTPPPAPAPPLHHNRALCHACRADPLRCFCVLPQPLRTRPFDCSLPLDDCLIIELHNWTRPQVGAGRRLGLRCLGS
jgi:hypothetical protein